MPDEKEPWADSAEYWKNVLFGVSLTFGIIPTLAYALRVCASIKVSRKVRADDIFMGFAVLFMWGTTAAVSMKAFNGIGTPDDKLSHIHDMRLSLGSWLVIKFWALSMGCVKISILLFLNHLLGTTRRMRMTLLAVGVFCIAWALVTFLYSFFFCSPVSYYWDKTIKGHCISDNHFRIGAMVIALLSLATDLIILIIPIPTVWRLQMRTKQKVAVTIILCLGIVVCVFSLLRSLQFIYFKTGDLATTSNRQSLWNILENDFAILCGCLPQLRPLFTRRKGGSGTNSQSTRSRKNSHSTSAHAFHFQGASGASSSRPPSARSPSDLENGLSTEMKPIEAHSPLNHGVSGENWWERDNQQSRLVLGASATPT